MVTVRRDLVRFVCMARRGRMWLYSEMWSGVVAIRRDLVAWVTVVVQRDLMPPGVVERRGLVGCLCTVRRSQSDVFAIRRDLVAGVWLYGEI